VELYKKYRPQELKEIYGQPEAVSQLERMIKKGGVPQTLLFSGPSGCGKTTMARIVAAAVGCLKNDLQEINAADTNGVGDVRELRAKMGLAPLYGDKRGWIIDECHQLSSDAQDALLKMTEDTPRHVQFVFCSTDTHKMKKTLVNRCTEIKVKAVNATALKGLVYEVCRKEKVGTPEEDVLDKLFDVCDGSPRKMLVLLEQVLALDTPKEQLAALTAGDARHAASELFKCLLSKAPWAATAKVLKGMAEEEPERVRHYVLAAAANVALGGGGGSRRAGEIIARFQYNFYDSKRAGLVLACMELSR
jgi:DNA polymerase III gamma/tau subunit